MQLRRFPRVLYVAGVRGFCRPLPNDSATAPARKHRIERTFWRRRLERIRQICAEYGSTLTDANLVPGLIPRQWAGAPAPYRGSTLFLSKGSGRGRRGRRLPRPVARHAAGRGTSAAPLAGRHRGAVPARRSAPAEAGHCGAPGRRPDGFRLKHWASFHRPQDGRAGRDLPSERTFRFHTPGVQLASLPDAQLVARCRAGDEDAWRELVSRFSRYVFAICSSGVPAAAGGLGGGLPGGLRRARISTSKSSATTRRSAPGSGS